MKTVTLTFNEALVLIAEGMTMNNVKTLANKLRNADAPSPHSTDAYNDALKQVEILKQNLKSLNQQVYDYERELEKVKAQSKTWEQSYHDAMANLDKAKQTEIKLRDDILKLSEACAHVNQENYEQTERANRMESKIRDLENDAKQDDESLKYFRKWVEELRVVLDCDKGMTTAGVFSEAVSNIHLHKKTAINLEKANDVIAMVKMAYDNQGSTQHKAICDIADVVEGYYLGN